ALKNAARLHPDNADIYKNLGILYVQGKKFKEAEEAWRSVVKLSPDDPEAHFYLATIYSTLKKNDAAEEELKYALELKPDFHEALNFLGYLYIEENRNLSKAEGLIKKALSLQPDNGAYLDSLGWFYFKKGDYKAALNELTKASSLVEDPVIHDHIGDTYFKIKDIPNARLNWEKSLELDPAQDSVRKKIEALINGRAANQNLAR
ncbi:MAG: tetratricopeptide repeat protein, partial [Candidatus Omnitrophota bacterium]|nr:tetratricopeptide repeat protein [Candidatus Omnitrophota bacterium]